MRGDLLCWMGLDRWDGYEGLKIQEAWRERREILKDRSITGRRIE